MIVVIEGISAAGKSTWCRQHAALQTVAETGRVDDAPQRALFPQEAARFWAARNAQRWSSALAMEAAATVAVCDTDPMKLHYVWCLHQIGQVPAAHWQLECAATRLLLCERALGFADLYLLSAVGPETAWRQRDGDRTRMRRNFELHLRLHEPLLRWYRALAAVLPQVVRFELPADGLAAIPSVPPSSFRYDVAVFDSFMARLS